MSEEKSKLIEARKLRRKYGIFLFPETESTALPFFKFEELSNKLNVDSQICLNLKKWGIKRPLPVQMQVIPIMLQGNDIQCCSPTGSGKTIAFVIPLLAILQNTIGTDAQVLQFCNDDNLSSETNNGLFSEVKCLVIAPTVVLAHQIFREFVKYSKGLQIGIHLLSSDVNSNNTNNDMCHIIVSTPKPLAKLITENTIPFHKF